jgi:hypothetical protein
MFESISAKVKSMRYTALWAGVLGTAVIFGACNTGVNPDPKKCECDEGTVKEFADSPCCEYENCACGIKQSYSLTFGNRNVVLNVPATGITQAQFTEIQRVLTEAATAAEANAPQFMSGTGNIVITISNTPSNPELYNYVDANSVEISINDLASFENALTGFYTEAQEYYESLSYELGDRHVVINVPAGGLSEEQISAIRDMLSSLNAAIESDPVAKWLSEQPGTLSVNIGEGYACDGATLTVPADCDKDTSFETAVHAAVETAAQDDLCNCPNGTEHEYSDDPCCDEDNCTCTVKLTHSHEFGNRPVEIQAPAGGLTEAQVTKIKTMLNGLATSSDPAAQWLKGQTGTLTVNIGNGYECTASTLTIPADFASNASFEADVLAAVVDGAPEFCRCPAGTVHEFADSQCCTAGDCNCDIETTHNLTLGSRPVTFNVPDGDWQRRKWKKCKIF